ncbi:MAG: DUF7576 family protein [Halobacteriota archaeon]
MVDPTSDLCEDVTEETAPRCAACGTPIVHEPTHKVVTRVDEGMVTTIHFCDADCRAAWDQ